MKMEDGLSVEALNQSLSINGSHSRGHFSMWPVLPLSYQLSLMTWNIKLVKSQHQLNRIL